MRVYLILISMLLPMFGEAYASLALSDLLVTTLPRKARQEIRIIAREKLPLTFTTSGNSLTLNFNGQVGDKQLMCLPVESKGWIKNINKSGPSSYHLTSKADTSFDVRQLDRTVVINVLENAPAHAKDTPVMVIDDTPARAELTLIWPEAHKVSIEERDEKYIFAIEKPLHNEKIGDLWKIMPRWISESNNYFDNFSLKLVENINLNITKMGPQVIMNFTYGRKQADLERHITPTPTTPGIRMARYKGQTLLNSERDFEARSEFSRIVGETPENLDAMRWLGDTEAHIRRWRRAILVYDHMFSLDPQEYGVAFRKAFLYHENGSYVQFDPEYYKVEGAETALVGRFSGRYILGQRAHIEGAFEERHLCGAPYSNRYGDVSIFKGARFQGFGAFVYQFDSLDKLHLGLYGSSHSLGGAAAYTFGWKHADTRFGLNYHTTDWNYVQQIVDGGNIDSVSIKHEHRFYEDTLFLDAIVAYNRFNLKFKDDLGRTTRVNATLNYNLVYEKDPTVTVGYGFSGEYVHDVKYGTNSLGVRFPYVPLIDRETHSLTTRIGAQMTDYIQTEGVLGYSYERYGRTSGPILGLGLIYEPIPNFSMGLRGSREILNARGSNSFVNALLGTITVRF